VAPNVSAETVATPLTFPTGTVTFLFTDIEGSTRLAGSLGQAWPPLLERHRQIVRAALTANGGLEVQTEGDGFFAVFTTAPAAIAAAVRAQRDLVAEPWPSDVSVRVRMGIHSGSGEVDRDGLYVGHDVHRASRVADAAHGGQVLISDTARALTGSTLPDGVSVRDLGEHRLKDLRPQPLAQLVIDDLPADFPPVRSLDARPNNLPVQLTSFVGRDRELQTVTDLLAATRLLTLTGPGGTGKTRLALQLAALVADDHRDGVWFVPLEPLRDPELVLPTVARTLGVFPGPGQSPIDALAASIGERQVLLLLDNFEQVVEAAGGVASLLRACPGLRVIVTSRAVLRVAGEQEYVVAGLPAPPDTRLLSRVELEELPATVRHPDAAELDQYEAVRLFVARALAVQPGFAVTNENAPAVAGITARLQGMPLAIELAAARVKLLTPEQILQRLEQQLGILTSAARDLPDRQRTLRGAIAWSYDLLDEPHRRLLGRLSVFRGGWQLEEAEVVAGMAAELEVDILDGLSDLVDQSLVRRADEQAGEARFAMLEAVREFAAELLVVSGEAAATRRAHASAYLAVAERSAPHLQGADQRRWLDRLEQDHDNLREALDWAIDLPDPPTAVRLAFALWRFWQQRGYLDEARSLLDRIAELGWEMEPELRARFAETAGGIAYWQADLPTATHWYDVALEIRRDAAAGAAGAGGDPESHRELANALYNRGYIPVAALMKSSDVNAPADPDARAMLEEALAIYRELGDIGGEGNLLWGLGGYLMFVGAAPEAEVYLRSAMELHRAAGQRTMEAWSLHMLSSALLIQARYTEAAEPSRHALRHFSRGGDVSGITLCLDTMSVIALSADDRLRGGRLWGAARQLQRVSGTGLAEWDARFLQTLPFGVQSVFTPAELDHLAAEGADLSLSEAVAYALGEADPFASA
jgi:predicted ATPase/class 3 adenylate cyclase